MLLRKYVSNTFSKRFKRLMHVFTFSLIISMQSELNLQ